MGVAVAYSGGVDSSVLLRALLAARESHPALRLSAIHVHHGLSANADAWATHCESVCRAWQVPLSVVRVTIADTKTLGIEAAARNARYASLLTHASTQNASIALAHHARDQAETVLLQLLRGSGPAGLAAMPEAARPFARPLLKVEKVAIDAYATEHGVAHIVDESNVDPRFARNRLRKFVWPVLETHFATAERTLARAATWQHESDELSHALADIDLASCTENDHLLASTWRSLSSARRRNALRVWLEKQGITTPSSERLLEWERQLLTQNATQNLVLTHSSFDGSIRCYRDRIQYVAAVSFDAASLAVGVRWSGEPRLKFAAGHVDFSQVNEHDRDVSTETNTQRLRPIRLGESWVIRARREKDKIHLSPKSGGISVKNLFQHANVPPWLRAEWPILTCNGRVAAIPGVAIDYEFAATEANVGYALAFRVAPRGTTRC